MEIFLIGEISKQTDCHIETIRYYEKIGLLPNPPRSTGGHRLYNTQHLKRLNFICRSRKLGFSIEEIRNLLELVDQNDFTCQEVYDITQKHLDDIHEKIRRLKKLKNTLKMMAEQCQGGTHPVCPIIETLSEV